MTKIEKIFNNLSERDKEALKSIYFFRCLSLQQIYELHYKKSLRTDDIVSDSYCRKKINDFTNEGILEKVSNLNQDIYFLTSDGVDIVKLYCDFPNNIYDNEKKIVRRGYYRASELKISNKYINHQLHMNQFLIEFKQKQWDINYLYYDEKHISKFSGIRPDGLLSINNVDFFLEMDMATESKKQLIEKWINYRHFLSTSEYKHLQNKIVVLFIIEGTSKIKERIDLIKYTINETLIDMIDDNFEIYIDTKDNLLNIIENKYIRVDEDSMDSFTLEVKSIFEDKFGFDVANGEKVKKYFNGTGFAYYCRQKNPETKNIIIDNNKIQEYVIDAYNSSPVSVLKKISYMQNANVFFKDSLNREISYIVIAESELQIYNDLKITNLLTTDNVYFTTIDRIKQKTFNESLFQFDTLGNLHTFENNGLMLRKFDSTIKDYFD